MTRKAVSYDSIANPVVAAKFATYPPGIREKLLTVRRLILETAAATEGVGELEETLKWGEPAYVTVASGSGSTVRIDWKKNAPAQYAIYFNCKTNLVETFRTLFPDCLVFGGNRAILFEECRELPLPELRLCIVAALTYHCNKRRRR